MASGGSARVSENSIAAKERFIDQMVAEFEQNLHIFSSDVKTTMRAVPTETAMRVFEVALVFLTQAFPNLTDCGDCSDDNRTGTRTFEDRLSALESKIEDQARTAEDELKLHGDRAKASQKKLEKSQDRHRKQLDQLQARVTKHGKNLRKLNESSNSCSESILGLKKLQTLFNKMLTIHKTTTATAQASAPPPTATTSSSQASAAASPRGPPKSLSQKHRFSAQVSVGRTTPDIRDVKLLPGGLVLLTDWNNECVKLFNTQGQHLHSQSLDEHPACLAVMDITSVSGWDVAVSLPVKNKVFILEVSNTRLSVKTSLSTPGECGVIAAVNAQTLAVGYLSPGIDLINLTGQVLRRLTSDVSLYFMSTTPDRRCLVVSTTSNTLVKLLLVDGKTFFDHKVAQIRTPTGITCQQDGSIIVVDISSNSLHLVSPEGRWVRHLLDCSSDSLFSLSSCQDVCVSCSLSGSVVVCDIVF